jgi:hypothetical protein
MYHTAMEINDNSSYTKICVALLKTKEFFEIESRFVNRLNQATFETKFEVENTTGRACVKTNFVVKYEPTLSEYNWPADSFASWTISSSKLVRTSESKWILDEAFGPNKAVKTRGCNYHTIESSCKKNNYVSFHDRVIHHLVSKHQDLVTETRGKLQRQCHEFLFTEEYKLRKNEFTVNACKDAIRSALLQWRDMPEEVIKEAFDQYIATVIMED